MAQPEVQNGGAEKVDGGSGAAAVSFAAVKPQLLVEAPKANEAVLFYKAAFGAEEVSRTLHPKRKAEQEVPLILSAELKIAGSSILVSDLVDDSVAPAKTEAKGGVVLCLETEDVGAAIAKAVSAGAVAEGDVDEGDGACRGGCVSKVKDPYGFIWLVCSPSNQRAEADA